MLAVFIMIPSMRLSRALICSYLIAQTSSCVLKRASVASMVAIIVFQNYTQLITNSILSLNVAAVANVMVVVSVSVNSVEYNFSPFL